MNIEAIFQNQVICLDLLGVETCKAKKRLHAKRNSCPTNFAKKRPDCFKGNVDKTLEIIFMLQMYFANDFSAHKLSRGPKHNIFRSRLVVSFTMAHNTILQS